MGRADIVAMLSAAALAAACFALGAYCDTRGALNVAALYFVGGVLAAAAAGIGCGMADNAIRAAFAKKAGR